MLAFPLYRQYSRSDKAKADHLFFERDHICSQLLGTPLAEISFEALAAAAAEAQEFASVPVVQAAVAGCMDY